MCEFNDFASHVTWRIHLQRRTKGVWYRRRVRVGETWGDVCVGDDGVLSAVINTDPLSAEGGEHGRVRMRMLTSAQVSGQRSD